MAQIKISELNQIQKVADDDLFVGVDVSENETINIQMGKFKEYVVGDIEGEIQKIDDKIDAFDTEVQSKIKDFDDNAQERLDEFNQYAGSFDKRIVDLDDRVHRIEEDVFEAGTAEGTEIEIKDADYAELKNLEVSVDNPQNKYEGKNYLKPSTKANTSYGVTGEFLEDGTLHVYGTCTGSSETSTINLTPNIYSDFPSGNYILSSDIPVERSLYIHAFTPTGDYKNITISAGYQQSSIINLSELYDHYTLRMSGVPGTEYDFYVRLMLEKDVTEPSEFEPYTGTIPSPSPELPQEIKSINENFEINSVCKNIWHKTTQYNGYYPSVYYNGSGLTIKKNADGTFTLNGTATGTEIRFFAAYNSLKPTSYMKFLNGDYRLYACINGNIAETQTTTTDGITTGTYSQNGKLELSENKHISSLCARVVKGVTYNNDILSFVLKEYEEDSSYEPSLHTTLNIDLKGNEMYKVNDTYKDKLFIGFDDKDGEYHLYLEKNIGKLVLDGTQNISYYGVFNNHNLFYSGKLTDADYTDGSYPITLCDNYVSIGNHPNAMENYQIRVENTDGTLYWNNDDFSDADDMKEYIKTHPMTICYILKKSQIIDLGVADEMLLSYPEYTNIYSSIDNVYLNVAYYRNFLDWVENTDTQVKENTENIKKLQHETLAVSNRVDRIEEDIFENGEVSGTELYIQDSSFAEFKHLDISPNEGQKGEPSPENPQPIPVLTSDDEIEFEIISPNIFDGLVENGAYSTDTGDKISSTAQIRSVNFMEVEPNTNYIFSIDSVAITEVPRYFFYDKDKIFISSITSTGINTPENCYYLTFHSSALRTKYGTDLPNPMIEKGTVVSKYVEKITNITKLPIPENEFVGYINDTYKDKFRIDFNKEDGEYHLYLDKVLAKKTLTGNETWNRGLNSTWSNNNYIYRVQLDDGLYRDSASNVPLVATSRYLGSSSIYSVISSEENVYASAIWYSSSKAQLMFLDKSFNGAPIDDYLQWVASNNIDVIYQLKNPYTLDLGVIDMPLTYEPVTNAKVIADLEMYINAKYYRDFHATIKSIQDRLTALESKVG